MNIDERIEQLRKGIKAIMDEEVLRMQIRHKEFMRSLYWQILLLIILLGVAGYLSRIPL